MATKWIARIASKTPYEYYQSESDSFQEMVEAEAFLRDHNGQAVGTDPAIAQATQNLQQGGVVPVNPGLAQPPAQQGGTWSQPAAPPARPQWQNGTAGNANGFDGERMLGETDGAKVTVHDKGRFGPYVKAYFPATKAKMFANVAPGIRHEDVTLEQAVAWIQAKAAKG